MRQLQTNRAIGLRKLFVMSKLDVTLDCLREHDRERDQEALTVSPDSWKWTGMSSNSQLISSVFRYLQVSYADHLP